jgi:hypothetical protein
VAVDIGGVPAPEMSISATTVAVKVFVIFIDAGIQHGYPTKFG